MSVKPCQPHLSLVIFDYAIDADLHGPKSAKEKKTRRVDDHLEALHHLSPEDVLDAQAVITSLGLNGEDHVLERSLPVRGGRLLSLLPRVTKTMVESITDHFATLSAILEASPGELAKVEGIGNKKARALKAGLAKLVERRGSEERLSQR